MYIFTANWIPLAKLGRFTMAHFVKQSRAYLVNEAQGKLALLHCIIATWRAEAKTGCTIHANINGRRVHKYKRLIDELHSNESTRILRSKKIVKAIKDNMS